MLHVWMVEGYNNRVIRLMLIFISSVALWSLMGVTYGTLFESRVPKIFGFLIFPISSLFMMALAINKISKIAPKQKRKAKE